ncbi:uncharacterized protein LOC110646152 [Hevea brasiliensis]|nr:uncharacterized protein LOC110646152 [Hevea brasiliensis]
MGNNNHDFSPFLFPSTTPFVPFSGSSFSSSYSVSPYSPSSPSLNSPSESYPSLPPHPAQSSSSSFNPSADAGNLGPCAACKIHRRRCTDKCYVASYLPPTDSHKFTVVDGMVGAANIFSYLQNNNSSSYVPLLLLLRDATTQDGELQADINGHKHTSTQQDPKILSAASNGDPFFNDDGDGITALKSLVRVSEG